MNTSQLLRTLICLTLLSSTLNLSCVVNTAPNQTEIDHQRFIEIEIERNGEKVKKVVPRTAIDSLDQGQLAAVNEFITTINPSYPDSNEFIFIKYHPGKDRCNSTGMMTRHDFGDRDIAFRSEIQQRDNITVSRVYKNDSGLKRYNKESTWYQDENHIIKRTFFKYHYPCSSHVVLHNSGKYFAYFGESYPLLYLKDIDLFQELIMLNESK